MTPTRWRPSPKLTGDLTIGEILAWVETNPSTSEPVPGVAEVTIVPQGAVTYVAVRAPGVGVVCQSTFLPIEILIADSLDVE
jgi:hypothetical protein